MKTKVDVLEAARLRGEGWTLEQVGQRYGVTRERVRQLVGPLSVSKACEWCEKSYRPYSVVQRTCSRGCRNRLLAAESRGVCRGCGGETARQDIEQCYECTQTQHDERRQQRRTLIKRLWDAGVPAKEIATQAGYANWNSLNQELSRMKHAGWDLPNRRPTWSAENLVAPPTKAPTTRQQVNARLRYAVRMGRVTPADACERCGKVGRVDGHHHDYSKPLDVEWLCRTCHIAHHVAERAESAEVA